MSLCDVGHIGPICGDCEKKFSKMDNECVPCLDSTTNIIRIIGALLLYITFLSGYSM